jgi:NitT/TauT family transport system ATP-binding protein
VLLPWLTVEENALLPFHVQRTTNNLTGEDIENRLKKLLELTNLLRFRRSFPHELSGGMQMRAALIRTLIVEPTLIFMDEPFAAIDELTRHDLGREFRNIARTTDAATVFVTHSIQEAAFLSDRIIIMSPRPSRIVEEVSVPFDPDEPRTEKLKRDRRFLDLCDQLRGVMAHG